MLWPALLCCALLCMVPCGCRLAGMLRAIGWSLLSCLGGEKSHAPTRALCPAPWQRPNWHCALPAHKHACIALLHTIHAAAGCRPLAGACSEQGHRPRQPGSRGCCPHELQPAVRAASGWLLRVLLTASKAGLRPPAQHAVVAPVPAPTPCPLCRESHSRVCAPNSLVTPPPKRSQPLLLQILLLPALPLLPHSPRLRPRLPVPLLA